MNDQLYNDSDPDLETMLRSVQLAQPTGELDRRISALFRPRWRMLIAPLSGFAAGVLMTIAVFHRATPAGGHTAPAANSSGSAVAQIADTPTKPQPIRMRAMLIENHDIATLGDGEVNGLPIRFEQSRSQLVLFQPTTGGGMWRAVVDMPPQRTVRNAKIY
jgi:hypothetical protein